jgi:putative transcriptional regulator
MDALTSEQLHDLRRSNPEEKNRIRVAREILDLTQQELADAIGVTQSAISDLERRRWGGTTVETARKLADAFGCSIDDLFPSKEQVA